MNINNLKIAGGEQQFILQVSFKYLCITSLLICFGVAAYFFYPKEKFTNEALFAKYYEEPNFPTRGSNAEVGLFYKAAYAMKEHNYQEAMKDFRLVLNECGFMHDHAQWYMMLCLLKTNSSEETIDAYLCDIIRKRGQYSSRATKILYCKSKQKEEND